MFPICEGHALGKIKSLRNWGFKCVLLRITEEKTLSLEDEDHYGTENRIEISQNQNGLNRGN